MIYIFTLNAIKECFIFVYNKDVFDSSVKHRFTYICVYISMSIKLKVSKRSKLFCKTNIPFHDAKYEYNVRLYLLLWRISTKTSSVYMKEKHYYRVYKHVHFFLFLRHISYKMKVCVKICLADFIRISRTINANIYTQKISLRAF